MGELASQPRRFFGEYEVESVLGKGAMGMVYLARDKRIGRRVALKTVQVQQTFEDESEATEFYQRLQREAEVCGAMQHPNIVTLYEPGYENNVISFLATEWVDGESLRDRLKRSKPLPLEDALRISEDILRGLAYAHMKGVIHRDIKPANILLSTEGQAKIADFGIARPVDSTLTAVGSMLGTPNYMSPEQVKCADVTARSDLFSVGVVMYEMLTGVKPFSATDVSSILRNVVERVPPLANEVNKDVPEPIAHFVAHLFAKEPEDRFGTAMEALGELHALRHGTSPGAPPELVGADAAVSTVAPGSNSKARDATTDRLYGDATPAIGTPKTNAISPAISFAIIGALAAVVITTIAVIRVRTDPTPMGVITPQQHAEFVLKKQSLATAHALLDAGRYDESIRAYDTYSRMHPESVVAREGLAEAMKAAEANKSGATVTAQATKQTGKKKTTPDKKQPPSLWQRIFRRGKTTSKP
ncbi:MAG: serine/threonine protein kinase [Acidobacteriota bacterium]|nr:serine/threonine protein kinase [Acidobacteriota bacterium]